MGKLINFPGSSGSGKKEKSENAQPENEGRFRKTRRQVKELARMIKNKSLLTLAERQALPDDFLLEFTKEEKQKDLQEAFELASGKKLSGDTRYFSEFLVIRRYLLAYIIVQACEVMGKTSKERKTKVDKVLEIIESLNNIALYNDWDWVSFNELEFDLFIALADLGQANKTKFLLNRSKQTYLVSALSFNSQFWNMQEAVGIYQNIWQQIEQQNPGKAKELFLDFYENNDKKIMRRYEELKEIN